MNKIKQALHVLRNQGGMELIRRVNRNVGVVSSKGTHSGLTCLRPYYRLTILDNAKVFCCCPGWVKYHLGTLSEENTLPDIWNGRRAQTFRDAMAKTQLDRVCKADVCPHMIDGNLPALENGKITFTEKSASVFPKDIVEDDEILSALRTGQKHVDFLPKSIELGVDDRCNLACPSCRDHRVTKISAKNEHLLDVVLVNLQAMGPSLRHLHMLGNGEVFYSPFTLKLLKNLDRIRFPNLSVNILTNGILLTDRMWERIGPGRDFIKTISISIDAATKETYESVRLGGTWERLLSNLAVVQRLKADHKLERTTINFVVSDVNFREIPDFIRLGEKYEMDQVVFTALQPWDRMDVDYAKSAVHLKDHPLHKEFRHVIDAPICEAHHVLMGVPR